MTPEEISTAQDISTLIKVNALGLMFSTAVFYSGALMSLAPETIKPDIRKIDQACTSGKIYSPLACLVKYGHDFVKPQ